MDSTPFFESGTFYIILWALCGLSFFIFRKKRKEEDEEMIKKAKEINKDSKLVQRMIDSQDNSQKNKTSFEDNFKEGSKRLLK